MFKLENPVKPTIFVAGRPGGISIPTQSLTSEWWTMEVWLENPNKSKPDKYRMVWIPRFFDRNYSPNVASSNLERFVYTTHIYRRHAGYSVKNENSPRRRMVGVTFLEAFHESSESFAEFAQKTHDIYEKSPSDNVFAADLRDLIMRCIEESNANIIWCLKQRWEKTGEYETPNGRQASIYELSSFYDVAGFFRDSEEERAKILGEIELAANTEGRSAKFIDRLIPD